MLMTEWWMGFAMTSLLTRMTGLWYQPAEAAQEAPHLVHAPVERLGSEYLAMHCVGISEHLEASGLMAFSSLGSGYAQCVWSLRHHDYP